MDANAHNKAPHAPADSASGNLAPLAVDAAGAAQLFSVGLRTWRRWDSSGKCPRGYGIGGRKLWRRSDLDRWAALGFPDRAAFEARQTAEREGVAAVV